MYYLCSSLYHHHHHHHHYRQSCMVMHFIVNDPLCTYTSNWETSNLKISIFPVFTECGHPFLCLCTTSSHSLTFKVQLACVSIYRCIIFLLWSVMHISVAHYTTWLPAEITGKRCREEKLVCPLFMCALCSKCTYHKLLTFTSQFCNILPSFLILYRRISYHTMFMYLPPHPPQ